MPFQLADLIEHFPVVYHLTATGNLTRIQQDYRLESAVALMRAAGRLDLIGVRRLQLTEIDVQGEVVTLRDQAPLHQGHVDFQAGWTLPMLVESLNSRVFFWPGDNDGPIAHGQRHFDRYAEQGPAVLRVSLQALIDANPNRPPFFCRFNSGSPRTVNGRKSPRGPDTFLPCQAFEHNHRRVVEVTFEDSVTLPIDGTEVRLEPSGAWCPLADT